MKYSDTIYGNFEIVEPVIIDLLETETMRRLKYVYSSGITGFVGLRKSSNRFEHSVGVMYLVKKYGGNLEEKIAALLHDVSHTAFSHVIDYVFNDHVQQEYHERKKEYFFEKTSLPEILQNYHLNWRDIIDEERYTLLEQPSPALCADRLDYFFRDSFGLGILNLTDIQVILDHLVTYEDRIVVNDKEVAIFISKKFIEVDDACWSNLQEVGLYELTAQAIQVAISTGKISEEDFWGTDDSLWMNLQAIDNNESLKDISKHTHFIFDHENPTFRVCTKIRTIDPDILFHGKLKKLSEIDCDYDSYRKQYIKRKEGLWPIRIVSKLNHNC